MLSAFVIARDAQATIIPVMKNLRRFADEVLLIVDEDSRDATDCLGQDYADEMYYDCVNGSYEAALNRTAALCRGDWIIFSHDDELWPAASRDAILQMTRQPGVGNVAFPRRHIVGDGTQYVTGAPLWPDIQLRLRDKQSWLRSPWPERVHASPAPDSFCQCPIWHMKFIVKAQEERQARLERWGEMWPESLSDHYRRFSIIEGYEYETAQVPEDAPEDLAEMLAGVDLIGGPCE